MRTRLALLAVVPAMAVVALQSPPRIHGTIDLTIGGADADENYSFARTVGLAMGADGRIYVADGQDQVVRAYSPTGKYLFKFGGTGGGPGEFGLLGAIAFGPDGMFWTRDEGNFRFQAFTVGETKAEYKSGRLMQQHARGIHQPIVFDAKGNTVEIGRVNGPNAGPYDYVRTSVDEASHPIAADTLRGPPEDSTGVRYVHMNKQVSPTSVVVGRYLYQPFGSVPTIAFAPNGAAASALTGRYVVTVTALGGARLRVLRRDVVGPEPTSKERATAEKDFNNALADVNLSRVTAPFKPLARKPPLDALTFSTDGDLWVQRTTAAGAPHEADVYDKNGRMVAVAEWPTGFALMSYRTTIAGRTALAVAMDSLDVERVVRVRFK